MLQIKEISPEETYGIRHKVLRPQQTIEDCKFEGDQSKGSFHLGAYLDQKLVSIASFYIERHPEIDGVLQYRLRGMATLEEYRKEKAGSSLLKRAEEIMLDHGADAWWCNARTGVAGYYKKQGLKENGEIFDLPPIGPHIVMYKNLV